MSWHSAEWCSGDWNRSCRRHVIRRASSRRFALNWRKPMLAVCHFAVDGRRWVVSGFALRILFRFHTRISRDWPCIGASGRVASFWKSIRRTICSFRWGTNLYFNRPFRCWAHYFQTPGHIPSCLVQSHICRNHHLTTDVCRTGLRNVAKHRLSGGFLSLPR
jgi:hypothetical protein